MGSCREPLAARQPPSRQACAAPTDDVLIIAEGVGRRAPAGAGASAPCAPACGSRSFGTSNAWARHMRPLLIPILAGALTPVLVAASADASEPLAPPAASASPPPAPYSLPWQLRPAAAVTAVRSDTAFAFYEDPKSSRSGETVATTLLLSYKVIPQLAPMVRLGLVSNAPPVGGSAVALVNPVVGATYVVNLVPGLRLAAYLGLTLPVGMGGGDSPDPEVALAARSGILARSAMDNAMFAVNDFTVFPGVDLVFMNSGFTVQAEATLLQLTRVRGDKVQPDASRTNFTAGLHVGYFVLPMLSVGAELRHQRWLSTPKAVAATPALRDTTTFAVGPRAHVEVSKGIWFRPGLAYARGLDDPMSGQDYNIVQLDLPLQF